MALDAATLVRAGGGIAFMAAGGVAFALARGAPPRGGHAPLGVALVAYGAAYAIYNFTAPLASTEAALLVQAPFVLLAAIGFLVFLVRGPWRVTANERLLRGLLTAAAVLLVVQVATRWGFGAAGRSAASDLAFAINNSAGFAMHMGAAVVAIMAAERALSSGDARRTRALGALAFGVEAHSAYFVGVNFVGPPGPFVSALPPILAVAYVGIPILACLSVTVAWLMATRAPNGHIGWLVSWGVLGMLLAGQLDPQGVTRETPLPTTLLPGIVRTIAALLVVFALTSGALDNGTRPAPAVRRSTMAAGALAVLFIVAQVAQNFLSAQYGLLMGGIVAGTFLFAASPIQRALEARGSPPRVELDETPRNASRREAAYLDACRFAMRDRRLTRAEEARLHRLADELGLTPSRAHELLVQAEAEAGVA